MKFTRVLDRPRFQVLVLDPDLIPYSVDVVIGNFIYELHFKVKPELMNDNPELLSMDDMEDKGVDGEGKDDVLEANNMQIDQGEQGQHEGDRRSAQIHRKGNSEAQETKRMLFQLQSPELTKLKISVLMNDKEMESDDGDVEHPVSELMDNSVEMHRGVAPSLAVQVQVKKMAAILEASPPSRRSKRWAETADKIKLERAEKMKVARNLDPSPQKGIIESPDKSFLNYSSEQVADNLNTIGIFLGTRNLDIGNVVERLKVLENDRCRDQDHKDEINNIFDLEEKEMVEEEGVDKLILNSLCS
jgi:hypothetical protein